MKEVKLLNITEDIAQLSYKLRGNDIVWKYMQCDSPVPATVESERRYYREVIADNSQRMFAIFYDGKYCGNAAVRKIVNGTAMITNYILYPELWGKGISTSVTRMIIDYAFSNLPIDLIYRWVDMDNMATRKIAISQGFYLAGESHPCKGKVRYEMTRTMWNNRNWRNE